MLTRKILQKRYYFLIENSFKMREKVKNDDVFILSDV